MTIFLTGLATLIGVGITTQVETCCDPECVNGWCFDGTCICDFPWEGVACEVERQQEQIAAQTRGQLTLTSKNARLKTQMASMNAQLAQVLASVQQLQDDVNKKASCRLTSTRLDERR